jgi:pilus assembly protein CpaE
VGCTTLAVNIALALNSQDTPTVLVDADLQFGDVTAFLNQQAHYSIVDIAAQADDLDEELLDEVLLLHEESGLRILPAPPRPELADEVHAEDISKALKMLKDLFAYVIVDTASYLDDIALAALEASDLIVTIAVPEIPSIKNARFFLDTMAELSIPRERILLVMNQVNRRDSITAEKVAGNLGREVVAEIPFDREAVKGAINHGKPLIRDKKTHPLVGQILNLVGEIRERVVNGALEEGEQ